MRFERLSLSERSRAESLLAAYCQRPENAGAYPGSRLFYHLCGAAAYAARYGNPPNYRQRAAYRMHKKRRAKLAAVACYGDPSAPAPVPQGGSPRGNRAPP